MDLLVVSWDGLLFGNHVMVLLVVVCLSWCGMACSLGAMSLSCLSLCGMVSLGAMGWSYLSRCRMVCSLGVMAWVFACPDVE